MTMTEAPVTLHLKTGDPLPGVRTGLTVLAYTPLRDREPGTYAYGVALVHDALNDLHPFVVWTVIARGPYATGVIAEQGDYLERIGEAVETYAARGGRP